MHRRGAGQLLSSQNQATGHAEVSIRFQAEYPNRRLTYAALKLLIRLLSPYFNRGLDFLLLARDLALHAGRQLRRIGWVPGQQWSL